MAYPDSRFPLTSPGAGPKVPAFTFPLLHFPLLGPFVHYRTYIGDHAAFGDW
jgi:hypothetical protein